MINWYILVILRARMVLSKMLKCKENASIWLMSPLDFKLISIKIQQFIVIAKDTRCQVSPKACNYQRKYPENDSHVSHQRCANVFYMILINIINWNMLVEEHEQSNCVQNLAKKAVFSPLLNICLLAILHGQHNFCMFQRNVNLPVYATFDTQNIEENWTAKYLL